MYVSVIKKTNVNTRGFKASCTPHNAMKLYERNIYIGEKCDLKK